MISCESEWDEGVLQYLFEEVMDYLQISKPEMISLLRTKQIGKRLRKDFHNNSLTDILDRKLVEGNLK